MNLSQISIKQPTLIVCCAIAICAVGLACFKLLGVELFPEVSLPIVSVTTVYPGAGPSEIETLISKPIEDEVSTISGLKRLSSKNLEGTSLVIAEFRNGVDIKYAEQQVRDKVSIAKVKLPTDAKEPLIKKTDPSDQPIMTLSLSTKEKVTDAQLFDIADQFLKTRLEQVDNVGSIEILGGRKREIHVTLDREALRRHELSVSAVANRVGASGENVPSGRVNVGNKESVFRSLGEFKNVNEVKDTLVSLFGNEVPTRISDVGTVTDTLEDEQSRAFVNGQKALFIDVYRQSGSNTLAVTEGVKKLMAKLKPELLTQPGGASLSIVRDASIQIDDNVQDVYETIIIAIGLTIITVYFFLGSARATIITSLSLPISLIGTFIFMYLLNFSINIISLLAMTLAVGLLVDDAIVIIENIFRRIDLGETPKHAAIEGTAEIQISVLAITLVVVSIFLPVGFMSGVVGQFLKQFGLTIALSMIVSFVVALTLIPMLSAYFSGEHHGKGEARHLPFGVRQFDQFQTWLEGKYRSLLKYTVNHPLIVLAITLVVFIACMFTATLVPGGFLPDADNGQVVIRMDMPSGTSLDGTNETASKIDAILHSYPNVKMTALTVGNTNGESNKAEIYVELKGGKQRLGTTSQFKEKIRHDLLPYAADNPVVADYDSSGSTDAPFTIDLIATNQDDLDQYASKFVSFLRKDPRLKDVDSTSRPGRPELQFKLKPGAAKVYGINTRTMGEELRAQIEGYTPAKFREEGREYDVRVRLKPEERNLEKDFHEVYVPNVNGKLVRLDSVADEVKTIGAASINRQNRGRYVRISANTAPGVGLGDVFADSVNYLTKTNPLPAGMHFSSAGQTENLEELQTSFLTAIGFGVMFIYLILASLYGSFVTPLTILIAFPLALSGAFLALFLFHETFSIFAILGVFLLIGVAGKNSILLVDFARQEIARGKSRSEALIAAGVTRLRPILMTSFALIAGTIPVAIGLNEASKQRSSMGVAIIGGLISATILTLVVVPAVFSYLDRYRIWSRNLMARITGVKIEASEFPDPHPDKLT
jgi:HAE1 family hydrophobic/amphiphilic exporter-1